MIHAPEDLKVSGDRGHGIPVVGGNLEMQGNVQFRAWADNRASY